MSEKTKSCSRSRNCRVKTTVKVSKKEFNGKNNFTCIILCTLLKLLYNSFTGQKRSLYDNGSQFDLFDPEGQNYIKIPSEDFSHNGMQANSLSQ